MGHFDTSIFVAGGHARDLECQARSEAFTFSLESSLKGAAKSFTQLFWNVLERWNEFLRVQHAEHADAETVSPRCSVLAAANPIYGNFDPSLDLVGAPNSIHICILWSSGGKQEMEAW